VRSRLAGVLVTARLRLDHRAKFANCQGTLLSSHVSPFAHVLIEYHLVIEQAITLAGRSLDGGSQRWGAPGAIPDCLVPTRTSKRATASTQSQAFPSGRAKNDYWPRIMRGTYPFSKSSQHRLVWALIRVHVPCINASPFSHSLPPEPRTGT
jgi:hypothetical protein